MSAELSRALAADGIRYSTVWEDHLLVEEGLAVAPGDRVLSIGGAGCNVLALLLRGARLVVALDVNPAQAALVELKRAGIRRLAHGEFLALLGVAPGPDPLALYERVRPSLPPSARAFWDERTALFSDPGVLHCGRLERWFRAFRDVHLARHAEPGAVDALLAGHGGPEQAAAFERLATPALERAFVEYFGRENMARHGRHEAQLEHVPAALDVGRWFWDRFRRTCMTQPLGGNFYLELFLGGAYRDPERGPIYLGRAAFDRLKDLVGRIEVVTEELDAFVTRQPAGAFDRLNLSDVFEYLSEEAAAATLARAARATRPGGRICWWSLLVPRAAPDALRARLRPHEALARSLGERDRAWFYRSFHVEEVTA